MSDLDLEAIRHRQQETARTRVYMWFSYSRELVHEDVPALCEEVERLHAERDRALDQVHALTCCGEARDDCVYLDAPTAS